MTSRERELEAPHRRLEPGPRILEKTAVAAYKGASRLLGMLPPAPSRFVIGRMARISPALLAHVLLPPGIMGIALALNVRQVLGAADMPIVAVVTFAATASEILAVFLPTDSEAAE